MSKKSRKRNKKILAALALAGGAAMLAKGRGKASVADTAVAPDGGTFAGGIHQGKIPKGEILKQRRLRAMNAVPPSMRGGEQHAEGYQRYVAPNRQWPGGYIGRKGGGIAKRGTGVALKSGGSVTGAAKRGFGRALMKGKK